MPARPSALPRALAACLRPLHCACLAVVFFFLASPVLLSFALLRDAPLPPVRAAAPAARAAARALALALVTPPPTNPWRAALLRGRLDWHDLVPLTFHVGARGEAAAEALSRHLREDAKVALLNVLQGRVGSALGAAAPAAAAPPHLRPALAAGGRSGSGSGSGSGGLAENWVAVGLGEAAGGGALGALEGCPLVRDGCLLHGSLLACLGSSLCGWCAASSTCLTRGGGSGVPCAPTPGTPRGEPAGALEVSGKRLEDTPGVLLVSAASVVAASSASASGNSSCSILLRETRLTVGIEGNSKMAYHWAGETLPGWVRAAASAPGGLGSVDTQVLYRGPWHDLLALSYIFSRNCPRSEQDAVLPRVCSSSSSSPWGAPAQLAAVGAVDEARLALFSEEASLAAAQRGLRPEAALAEAVQLGGLRLSLRQAREVLAGIAKGEPRYEAWLPAPLQAPPRSSGSVGVAAAALAAVEQPPQQQLLQLPPRGLLRKEAAWLAGKGLVLAGDADFPELAGAVCMGEGSWGAAGGSGGRGEELEEEEGGSSGGSGGGGGGIGAQPLPLVVILSRRDKRLLLNEEELVAVVHSLGARAVVVALENLPLCAQVRLFRSAAVLLGMHGSGLINSMHMRPGSALVQVVPYHLAGAETFFRGTAAAHGVRYLELPTTSRAAAIAHAHFLKEAGRAEEFLEEGSGCCGSSVYFSFFINQDVVVDVEGARGVLREALKARKG
jgi:hypothetical protein